MTVRCLLFVEEVTHGENGAINAWRIFEQISFKWCPGAFTFTVLCVMDRLVGQAESGPIAARIDLIDPDGKVLRRLDSTLAPPTLEEISKQIIWDVNELTFRSVGRYEAILYLNEQRVAIAPLEIRTS